VGLEQGPVLRGDSGQPLPPGLAGGVRPGHARVGGVEHEIRDALTNLIFNAVDALPQGGTIEVRTSLLNSDAANQQVRLEVSDSGIGMDEQTRRRCLEPFFTTKGERGTGLGLAMVYGMAQRHGAELQIDSQPGRGTTVRTLFPIGAAAAGDTGRVPVLRVVSRSLRILIVDDDAALIQSLRSSLQEEGHQVTAAAGGQEGIEAFHRARLSPEPFDVVITDLGMPYVDGRQVIASIRPASARTISSRRASPRHRRSPSSNPVATTVPVRSRKSPSTPRPPTTSVCVIFRCTTR